MTLVKFINEVGFKVREGDVNKVNDSIQGIKSTATKLLGAIGIGFSLTKINSLVEEFGRVNEQIRNSTEALGDQAEIQQKIMESAKKTRSNYSETAGVISDLVHESPDLFGNIDEAVKFNNAATMLFKSAGKTNEDISGLMEAINKSFAKGYVDSETISQLLEKSPEAVELLNKKLGTTSDKLEEMASSKTMTVADLKAAFVDNADVIEQKFSGVQYRITDALTVIRSEWGLWLTQMDSTLGITNTIANAIVKFSDTAMRVMNRVRNATVWLSEKLGGTDKLLRLLAITAGALFFSFKFDKITTAVANIIKGLKGINAQTLMMAAELIIVALLVEDFINFMQGNDSLFGELLKKAGVDCGAVRQKVSETWAAITRILTVAKNAIAKIAGVIGKALAGAFKLGTDIAAGLIQALAKTSEWLGKHKTVLTLVGIAVGALTAAIIANNIATKIMDLGGIARIAWMAGMRLQFALSTIALHAHTAATWLANTASTAFAATMAFLTSPITLVILAIAALIAIIVLLVKNWDKVKAFALKCWEAIKGVWGQVVDFFKGIWDGIVSVFSTVGAWFTGVFTAAWEGIVSVFSQIGSFLDGIWQGVVQTVSDIKNSIVEGLTTAIDWIKSLPAQALQWGADIIQGIVDGIKGAIGKVGEAVSGVADKIKGFLGFSEPDEGPLSDFHTYMPDMIDLMAKGISEGKAKIRDALGTLTGDMSIMAKANVVGANTARTATGNSSVSKSVVQNVNINNKFEGDRAGQQKSAAAMDKATGDSTAELARALAYAR